MSAIKAATLFGNAVWECIQSFNRFLMTRYPEVIAVIGSIAVILIVSKVVNFRHSMDGRGRRKKILGRKPMDDYDAVVAEIKRFFDDSKADGVTKEGISRHVTRSKVRKDIRDSISHAQVPKGKEKGLHFI
ncbi:uncharacterized protein LOC117315127 [Pecten maximus]|uniref:uncharacterized protein LOC117315127 n=1 Tax=Pecten maximus TaxID=6579 RepID=UPI0014590518|nr:uncharacterized protein LOC117315127 [Pecten maximus]